MLALVAALALVIIFTVDSVKGMLQVLPYYDAPLAAAATALFATCALLLGGISALGAALLARDLRSRGPRRRGPLIRAAVAAGFLIVCCLSQLAGTAALGGMSGSEGVEALHQALLALWDAALYVLVPSVIALIALCFGAGQPRRTN